MKVIASSNGEKTIALRFVKCLHICGFINNLYWRSCSHHDLFEILFLIKNVLFT